MKNIQVSDEMYEFLTNLSKELNTQYHRGTRMPYIFQVQTQEQVAVPEGCGTVGWHYDGTLLKDDEDIMNAVIEFKEWSVEYSEKHYCELEDREIEDTLEKAGYTKVNYDYKSNLENAFLTSKACDEHIKANKHNLKQPVNYLSGCYRNPELETLMQFLCELTGGKLHT